MNKYVIHYYNPHAQQSQKEYVYASCDEEAEYMLHQFCLKFFHETPTELEDFIDGEHYVTEYNEDPHFMTLNELLRK